MRLVMSLTEALKLLNGWWNSACTSCPPMQVQPLGLLLCLRCGLPQKLLRVRSIFRQLRTWLVAWRVRLSSGAVCFLMLHRLSVESSQSVVVYIAKPSHLPAEACSVNPVLQALLFPYESAPFCSSA